MDPKPILRPAILRSANALSRSSLGLGPFLDELESRLQALHAEEMASALLAHAERLPPLQRKPFLQMFASGDGSEPAAETGYEAAAAVACADADAAAFRRELHAAVRESPFLPAPAAANGDRKSFSGGHAARSLGTLAS